MSIFFANTQNLRKNYLISNRGNCSRKPTDFMQGLQSLEGFEVDFFREMCQQVSNFRKLGLTSLKVH